MKGRFILLIFFVSFVTFGQEVRTIQPSIMIIPYTKQGEDIRTKIQNDFNIRTAISTVTEGFKARAYDTKDFETLLKALLRDEAVMSENQTDFRDRIFQNAGTDIIVELDTEYFQSGSGNSFKIILRGNDVHSGTSYSSINCESGKYYTTDIAKLADKAVTNCINPFLDMMNEKFGEIVENGKSVKIIFEFSQDSDWSMSRTVPSKNEKLKYVIEDWLNESAFKNYVVISTVTDTQLMVEEFRYPLRDPKTNQNNTPRTVERKIETFLESINIPFKSDNNRSTIYVTIK